MSSSLNIYEINTLIWLNKLSIKYKTGINLSNIPDEEWDSLKEKGFNSVWLMGVWKRSSVALKINLSDQAFIENMKTVLPDFNPSTDLAGSAYSISDYNINSLIGSHEDLLKVRSDINKRGMKLILDFVPNHVAPDHPWAESNPEYFIRGVPQDLNDSSAFIEIGANIYAKGKDPEYEPWSDVLQLNAFSKELRSAVIDLLISISKVADGVRCDMAMLLMNRIFSKTWEGRLAYYPKTEYWTEITKAVKDKCPDFIFIAESYWQTQEELLSFGFDYCYDKDFLDFLKEDSVNKIKHDLNLKLEEQIQLVRFLENHDEDRAASAMPWEKHQLCLLIIATTPSSKMIYDGQAEGLSVRTPVQLNREPFQEVDSGISGYYHRLFALQNIFSTDISSYKLINGLEDKIIAWSFSSNSKDYFVISNYDPTTKKTEILIDQTFDNIKQVFNTQSSNNETDVNISQNKISLNLQGCQGLVFELY